MNDSAPVPTSPSAASQSTASRAAASRATPTEPPRHPRRILVVGAGMAGLRTAAELRARGHDGHLTVLGAESVPPYDRPPLSKELLSRTSPSWLADEGYGRLDELADLVRLDDPATALRAEDATATVTTASGDELTADLLVLACGSTPVRRRGLERVHRLHTHTDADRLRAALGAADASRTRLVCLGAGWIGAEIASVAAGAGAEVTVVEAAPAPLHRHLGPAVAAHLRRWYDHAGVTLLLGEQATEVTGGVSSRERHVRLASGDVLAADVVLDATGVRPATDWLAGSLPLNRRGAPQVDLAGRMLDGPASVRAVGDCADRLSPRDGLVPGGHWDGALHHPAALAADVLGTEPPDPADPAPYVFSTQFGRHLTVIGVPTPSARVLWRGDPAGESWTALYLEDSAQASSDDPSRDEAPGKAGDAPARVRAAITVDRPRDVGALRRSLSGRELPWIDPEMASAPEVPLKRALRAH